MEINETFNKYSLSELVKIKLEQIRQQIKALEKQEKEALKFLDKVGDKSEDFDLSEVVGKEKRIITPEQPRNLT